MDKCLTVVGSAATQDDFEVNLESWLREPFSIKAVIPLDFDTAARRKNFLAYVDAIGSGSDDEGLEMLSQALSGEYRTAIHESADDAIEFATTEYGEVAYSAFTEPITSKEHFMKDVFISLITAGEATIVRALLNKRPILALVHDGTGDRYNDRVMTPLAILVDDELGPQIELPVKSSYKT